MTPLRWAALIIICLAACASAQSSATPTPTPTPTPDSPSINGYVRPDEHMRRMRYIKSVVGPMALGTAVLSAGWSTARNRPEEWGPHWQGFGKRLASNLGKRAIGNTLEFGLDETLDLDSHYYVSGGSTRGRVKNAVISAVTARNAEGKRVVGIPRLVGTYASNIIAAAAWYPGRVTWSDGVRNGTTSIGTHIFFNLVKEFVRR